MHHPTPLHCFQYPPPTKAIVDRIGQQLLQIPEFYFRVLDIMQCMNLPAPFFDDTTNEPKSAVVDTAISCGKKLSTNFDGGGPVSESDEDIETPQRFDGNESGITKLNTGDKNRLKRILVNAKSAPTKCFKTQLFDDLASRLSRRRIPISLKLSTSSNRCQIAASAAVGNFGTFDPSPPDQSKCDRADSPEFDLSTCLSLAEIRRGVITKNQKRNYSVFKNYSPGPVSCRLYVKNISKTATRDDLRRLFGTFVTKETLSSFDVCLMVRGKLHGQAFVSFANDDEARNALRETNAYLLYEKPIVVMFARSARK